MVGPVPWCSCSILCPEWFVTTRTVALQIRCGREGQGKQSPGNKMLRKPTALVKGMIQIALQGQQAKRHPHKLLSALCRFTDNGTGTLEKLVSSSQWSPGRWAPRSRTSAMRCDEDGLDLDHT